MEDEKVMLHRFLFVIKNKNGYELSCSAEFMGKKEEAYNYFSNAVSGFDIELIDVSDETEWEKHSH